MNQLKYEQIIAQEKIELSEFTPEIMKEIKSIQALQKIVQNLPEEDPKHLELQQKDEALCVAINKWLDEPVSSNEPPKNEPPKEEPPKNEPPKEEPPKNEPPKEEPPKNEPPKEEPPKSEPPKSEPPKSEPPKEEPPKNEPPSDAEIVNEIISQLNPQKRIHINKLTEILGKKPNFPQHNFSTLKLRRVYLGDGWYEVVK